MKEPPFIAIKDQTVFEKTDLNQIYQYVISIQDKLDNGLVLRPDYRGIRLNLYFDDILEGPNSVTPEDIEKLKRFSLCWLETANEDRWFARLMIHCFAGISRSSACAIMPLSLYYESYREAARVLFDIHNYAKPNFRILYLIGESLGNYGNNILEDVLNGEMDKRRAVWDRMIENEHHRS